MTDDWLVVITRSICLVRDGLHWHRTHTESAALPCAIIDLPRYYMAGNRPDQRYINPDAADISY